MASAPFLCTRCTRALRSKSVLPPALPKRRHLSRSRPLSLSADYSQASSDPSQSKNAPPGSSSQTRRPADADTPSKPAPESDAMTRRLEQATEDALLMGGRAGRRAIEEAGFSEELKARLLDKVADAKFQSEHASALVQAGVASQIPSAAGQGTRAMAAARPWTGEEETEDTVLRMLDDARKPLAPELRGKGKAPAPAPVDLRLRRAGPVSPGRRAADARDRAQAYAGMGMKKTAGLSEAEREALKQEFRERFTPGARALPNSVSALAALANERIEDAIARGQFKNIPRGKGVERDTRADNPFIDTTEYIMNKMIKRQEIVPPWIEKQQELIKAAENFRSRLRNDWKRHAARMIASRGGTLEEQIARANAYARAEEIHNPRRRDVDQISVPTNTTDDVVMQRLQQLSPSASSSSSPSSSPPPASSSSSSSSSATDPPPAPHPFRDPDWEEAERPYMTLAVSNLNALTRSYNLMAPELAKKPYFSLERELRSCFADVAPQVADEIRLRATQPERSLVDRPFGGGGGGGQQGGGGLFGGGSSSVRVYESKEKHYGFREFWRDLWRSWVG